MRCQIFAFKKSGHLPDAHIQSDSEVFVKIFGTEKLLCFILKRNIKVFPFRTRYVS